MDSRSYSSGFYVSVTGQINGCQMQGYDNLYCKYSFSKGHDWSVLAGVEHGVSQISRRAASGGGGGGFDSAGEVFTWNYPIEVMFRSTNVHGWPQIVISVYGLTMFGGDVIRGYGCTHLPTTPGRHVKYVPLYVPLSSSLCQRLTAWITGNPPEFFDSKFIAQGKGREVTRVRSQGRVKITFQVTTKNMTEWGYQVQPERRADHESLMAVPPSPRRMSLQSSSSSSSSSTAPNPNSSSTSSAAALLARLKQRNSEKESKNDDEKKEEKKYDNWSERRSLTATLTSTTTTTATASNVTEQDGGVIRAPSRRNSLTSNEPLLDSKLSSSTRTSPTLGPTTLRSR